MIIPLTSQLHESLCMLTSAFVRILLRFLCFCDIRRKIVIDELISQDIEGAEELYYTSQGDCQNCAVCLCFCDIWRLVVIDELIRQRIQGAGRSCWIYFSQDYVGQNRVNFFVFVSVTSLEKVVIGEVLIR